MAHPHLPYATNMSYTKSNKIYKMSIQTMTMPNT